MKLYAPGYYRDFVCIADRCRHSCCVGWEIDVDPLTMEKYLSFANSEEDGYAKTIVNSIDTGETPHFILCEDEKCPHLDENGLCRIIKNVGEDALCDICRLHPRFFNETVRGREVGLGMSCEEACRLILSSDDYLPVEIGELNGEPDAIDYDPLPMREKMYRILSDERLSYPVKLQIMYSEAGASPKSLSDDEWKAVILSLEYLNEADKTLFTGYSSSGETPFDLEKYLSRALSYFIYRHASEAYSEEDLKASLGLCFFLERLLLSAAKKHGFYDFESFCEIARIVSEELEYSEDNTDRIKSEFLF